MNLTKFTAVGRPLDPHYLTNRVIALLSLAVMAGGFTFCLLSRGDPGRSALWGLGAGFSVFFAWALCRELDPDHDLSAFAGAGLALIGIFVCGLPSLGLLLWLLLLVRIVNRTTGLQATVLDSVALMGLGGWLVYKGSWEFGLVTAAAFFLDSRLQSGHKRQLLFAGMMMIATTVFVIGQPHILGNAGLFWGAAGVALGFSIVFIPVMLGTGALASAGDVTGKPLVPSRVLSGQVLALLSGIIAALWSGPSGLLELLSFWAAILGAALYQFFLLIFLKRRP